MTRGPGRPGPTGRAVPDEASPGPAASGGAAAPEEAASGGPAHGGDPAREPPEAPPGPVRPFGEEGGFGEYELAGESEALGGSCSAVDSWADAASSEIDCRLRARIFRIDRLRLLRIEGLRAWRTSVGRPLGPLAESIGRLGLARPLWVAEDASGDPIVIAGGRRLAALRLLGRSEAPCLAHPGPRLVALSVGDNLDRGLNPAETALAWRLARLAAGPEERAVVASMLGLGPRDRRLPALEAAADLGGRILEALAAGTLDLDNVEPLAGLAPPERDLVLDVFAAARPSRSNRRAWLEIFGDLRRIRGAGLDSIFAKRPDGTPAAGEAAALAEAMASGPIAERRVGALLDELRRPEVARLRRGRLEILRSLKLPAGLSVTLDPELEDAAPEVRLTLNSAADLGPLARAALELSERPQLARLFLEDEPAEDDPAGAGGGPPAGGSERGGSEFGGSASGPGRTGPKRTGR